MLYGEGILIAQLCDKEIRSATEYFSLLESGKNTDDKAWCSAKLRCGCCSVKRELFCGKRSPVFVRVTCDDCQDKFKCYTSMPLQSWGEAVKAD